MDRRTVEYLFALRDLYSPGAKAIAESTKAARANIEAMGKAAVEAAKNVATISGAASAAAQAVASKSSVMDRARSVMASYAEQSRKVADAIRGEGKAMDAVRRSEAHQQAREHLRNGSMANRARTVGNGVAAAARAAEGMSPFENVQAIVKQADTTNKIVLKMEQAGVPTYGGGMDHENHRIAGVDDALRSAGEMTQKYKNLSTGELMHLIDSGRGIVGTQAHIIESMDALSEGLSLLKAWDGDKTGHAGETEMHAALMSAELMGYTEKDKIAKHLKMLTNVKIAFGGKLSLSSYLTAHRAAGTNLTGMADDFVYGTFPALVQMMGPGAGVGMTGFANKMGSKTGHRGYSLEAFRKLGLLEAFKLNKKGEVDLADFRHNGKFVGADLAATDHKRYANEVLKPAIMKSMPQDFDLAAAVKASQVKGFDFDKTNDKHIRHLKEKVGILYGDRVVMRYIVEMILNEGKLKKDIGLVKQVIGDAFKFIGSDLDAAFQMVRAQTDNLFGAVMNPTSQRDSGFMSYVASFLRARGANMANAQQWVKDNPRTSSYAVGGVVTGAGLFIAAGAIGMIKAGLIWISSFALNTVLGRSLLLPFVALGGVLGNLAKFRLGAAGMAGLALLAGIMPLLRILAKGAVFALVFTGLEWAWTHLDQLKGLWNNPWKAVDLVFNGLAWAKTQVLALWQSFRDMPAVQGTIDIIGSAFGKLGGFLKDPVAQTRTWLDSLFEAEIAVMNLADTLSDPDAFRAAFPVARKGDQHPGVGDGKVAVVDGWASAIPSMMDMLEGPRRMINEIRECWERPWKGVLLTLIGIDKAIDHVGELWAWLTKPVDIKIDLDTDILDKKFQAMIERWKNWWKPDMYSESAGKQAKATLSRVPVIGQAAARAQHMISGKGAYVDPRALENFPDIDAQQHAATGFSRKALANLRDAFGVDGKYGPKAYGPDAPAVPSALDRVKEFFVKQEVAVNSTVDVTAPQSITVNLVGPGVSGQGSIQLSAAPRGQAMATSPNPKVQDAWSGSGGRQW
jgi:hypothetical protein